MKICFCAQGNSKEDALSPVFGRCPFFQIYDEESQTYTVMENTAKQESHGAGISAAQSLLDAKVDVLLTNALGPKAKQVLDTSEIKVYKQAGESVEDALTLFHEDKLELL